MVIGLHISTTTSAAFEDDEAGEVARILRDAADKVEARGLGSTIVLHDVNGNRVGEVQVTGRD